MNKEEFRIDEVKGLKDKIEYIRIGNKILRGYKYSDVIHGLIRNAISSGNYESLEAGRTIYFDQKDFSNTYEYQGWYYTIPKRKQDQIDKIIKILKITNSNLDNIHVKFISDAEELIKNQQVEEAEKLQRKIEADKSKYYAAIINMEPQITDEELRKNIFEECAMGMKYNMPFDYRQFERKVTDLKAEREHLRQINIEKQKRHIDWLLNDEKQAELFNCSVEEYVAKYKADNIMEIV